MLCSNLEPGSARPAPANPLTPLRSLAHKNGVCHGAYTPTQPYRSILPRERQIVSMSVINSLVPARFLTLIAHLVIVIIIFWSRKNSVSACLPLNYTDEEYRLEDTRYLVGFLCGVSMFNNNQALLCILTRSTSSPQAQLTCLLLQMDILTFIILEQSKKRNAVLNAVLDHYVAIACHASGSVALLFFLFEQWTCSIYWWIFGFCSVIPALYEMILFVVVFGFKKKPL
ncbi:Transmembrane protein 107 [Labeo rohita]|uniref:Transmembrane protein 107 n=1 Tax=Labeo rohita TaxID=84645 RepID=A0ABQ8LGX4_LABRO|nr:Transmembrane protein 107 [Labeo rohita]